WVQPPCANPPSVSSFAPPGAWITPSKVTNSATMSSLMLLLLLAARGLPARGLEQFDRIAVGIFHEDLLAARTDFHLVAKARGEGPELADACGQVLHLEDHPVPATRLLLPTVRHPPGARRPGTAEDQLESSHGDLSERRRVLLVQIEPQREGIEG